MSTKPRAIQGLVINVLASVKARLSWIGIYRLQCATIFSTTGCSQIGTTIFGRWGAAGHDRLLLASRRRSLLLLQAVVHDTLEILVTEHLRMAAFRRGI